MQALADRVAFWLTLIAVIVSGGTFAVWLAVSPLVTAVSRAVTVLVIACPHALGLAIPLVVALSSGLAARQGVLIRSRQAFERARLVDTVVFDKTGTLTRGQFAVAELALAPGWSAEQAIALAAAVEAGAEYPIAQAIVRRAAERGIQLPSAEGVTALPGRGVAARVNGQHVVVGRPTLLAQVPAWLESALATWAERGVTVAVLVVDAQPAAAA